MGIHNSRGLFGKASSVPGLISTEWMEFTTFTSGTPAGGDVAWVSPGDAASEDATTTNYTLGNPASPCEFLKATNIKSHVHGNSIIRGVEVRIKRKATFGSNTDLLVQLFVGGVAAGDDKADGDQPRGVAVDHVEILVEVESKGAGHGRHRQEE